MRLRGELLKKYEAKKKNVLNVSKDLFSSMCLRLRTYSRIKNNSTRRILKYILNAKR